MNKAIKRQNTLQVKLSQIDRDIENNKSVSSLSALNLIGLELTAGMDVDLDSELIDDEEM